MYYIQLSSRLTSFKSMSVKPYFQPENTHNIKPDEPEVTTKLDELEVPVELDELEVPAELDKLEVPAELDKLEAPLPTLEVPQEFTKPIKPIKHS